jgi:phosphoribosylformimino-5-aminoimidazole carboxamide ribotide isomerase
VNRSAASASPRLVAAPAVDLRGGRCVQLVGGDVAEERVSLPDPVAVAASWWALGFGTLHVVDLDAALGLGGNGPLIREIVRATPAVVQVGGGLRDDAAVDAVLGAGAARAVVGTRAVDDADWLETVARRHPGRVIVAADVRAGVVLRKGWTESSPLAVEALLARLEGLPLAGVLCTDVAREGRMEGIDAAAAARVVRASAHPTWISGGVTTMAELEALDAAGAAGAVLGMAIYTGKLDAAAVASLYGVRSRGAQETVDR